MNCETKKIIKSDDGLYQIDGIWDNPSTYDRYTITFKTWDKKRHKWAKNQEPNEMTMCLCLSSECNSPQGVNTFSVCQEGNHLGRKIKFEMLPCLIQNAIMDRIRK